MTREIFLIHGLFTDASGVDHAISVVTAALEAAGQVDTRLLTPVSVRRALVDVDAGAPVGAEAVAGRARADEAAGRVAAAVRARRRRRALVDVRAAGADAVHLVAAVAQAPVRTHRVDAAAVRAAGVRHHATLVQICGASSAAARPQ